MQPLVQTESFTITSKATQAIRDLLAERKLEGYALRIFVAGKSCSGYQYGMSLDNNYPDTDTIVETNGIKVVIDESSVAYLKGARLDFIDDERGKGFMVDNPNAEPTSCSCDGGNCCS
jgi:iron-sulfur cluster assembly accessory protein